VPGKEFRDKRGDPSLSQDILFTLVRVCWRSYPRGYSMLLRRPFQPSPPPSTHTRLPKESSAAFRILAITSHAAKSPSPEPPGPTLPEDHARPAYALGSKRSVCTPSAYARAIRYICGVPGGLPVNFSDMSLELEEFDLRGSKGAEGGANWMVVRVPAEVLIRFLYGIEMRRRRRDDESYKKFFDLAVSKI